MFPVMDMPLNDVALKTVNDHTEKYGAYAPGSDTCSGNPTITGLCSHTDGDAQ